MTKNSEQKLKYLKNRRYGENKSIFIIFKGLLAGKICLRLESATSGKPFWLNNSKLTFALSRNFYRANILPLHLKYFRALRSNHLQVLCKKGFREKKL